MSTNQSMIGFIKEAVTDLKQTKLVYFRSHFNTQQVFSDISCVGTFLKHHGVNKGDSVIICLPNIPQGIVALYAINSVGAIANIVHPKIGTDGLMKIVRESNTKWVFMFDKFVNKHRKALLEADVKIISCRLTDCMIGYKRFLRVVEPSMALKSNVITYNRTLIKPQEYDVDIQGGDTAVYLHSSGTTGVPKSVLLSNYAMNELAANLYEYLADDINLNPEDGMLMILPLFHGFGLAVCVHFMMYFGHIILVPMFNPKSAIKAMKRTKVTLVSCVPNMLRKMLTTKGFEAPYLKNIKNIFVGGDKLDEGLRKEVQDAIERNGGKGFCDEGFGLSETASVTHVNIQHKYGGTVGKPLPNVKVKIIKDGEEVPPMTEGDIFISSTSMMSGYLDKGEDNIKLDADGVKWLDTGDIGYVDEEGFLYYKGRMKRMLKIGGVNIFPQEVEAVASELKEINTACAVRVKINGKPALKLLVILNPNYKMTASLKTKICDTVRSHILPYAVPRIIEEVDNLAMTGMGKTDYRYYEELEEKNQK